MQQPYLIYVGPVLDNSNYSKVQQEIKAVIDTAIEEILSKLKKDRPKGYFNNVEFAFLKEKLIGDKFEIHTNPFKGGNGVYSFIPYPKRIELLAQLLSVVKNNNLQIYGVILDKEIIVNDQGIPSKSKNDEMYKMALRELIQDTSKKLDKDKGFIIVDAGNIGVNKYLKNLLIEDPSYRLMHEIIEVHSHENLMIQLADVCAYVIAVYMRMEYKGLSGSNDIKDLYTLIEDNLDIRYIAAEATEEA